MYFAFVWNFPPEKFVTQTTHIDSSAIILYQLSSGTCSKKNNEKHCAKLIVKCDLFQYQWDNVNTLTCKSLRKSSLTWHRSGVYIRQHQNILVYFKVHFTLSHGMSQIKVQSTQKFESFRGILTISSSKLRGRFIFEFFM